MFTQIEVLVDEQDIDLLSEYSVFVTKNSYAMATKSGKMVYLHRLILERKLGRTLKKGEDTDHINRNRLDNQRTNLRVATRSQNLANKTPNKPSSSGLIGVYLEGIVKGKPWKAQVGKKNIGRFATVHEAATARDAFIKNSGDEFRRLSNG
jgi:hypothetical protein